MRIYTRVVLDSAGNTLEEESFDYVGPLALCGGGGGTTVNIPKPPEPTAQELALISKQTSLLGLQEANIKDSYNIQNLLAPYVYQQMGLAPQYSTEFTSEQYAARNRVLEAEKRSLTSGSPPTTYNPIIGFDEQNNPIRSETSARLVNKKGDTIAATYTSTLNGLDALLEQYPKTPPITGFEKTTLPGELTTDELKRLSEYSGSGKNLTDIMQETDLDSYELTNYIDFLNKERSYKALTGQLPIDPALQHELDLEEQKISELLRKELGPGWKTSTPGMESMDIFQRRKMEVQQSFREGQLSTAEALALQTSQAIKQNQQQTFGSLINAAGYPYGQNYLGTAQGYSQPTNWYANNRAMEYQWGKDQAMAKLQSDMFNSQMQAGQSAGIGKMAGSLGGLLFGLI